MAKRKSEGPRSRRFIDETMALISEKGGSRNVNLREICRRMGCAHTNVYNYYASLDELLWAAFRSTLAVYANAITDGLESSASGHTYFRRLISNLVGFAIDNPGLYRFIGSDPIDPAQIPDDIIATVTRLKTFFIDAIHALDDGRMDRDEAETTGNIVLAYLDGEVLNQINGRVLPDEDVVGRVIDNAERLFTLLSARTSDGIDLSRDARRPNAHNYPRLEPAPVVSP